MEVKLRLGFESRRCLDSRLVLESSLVLESRLVLESKFGLESSHLLGDRQQSSLVAHLEEYLEESLVGSSLC